MRLDLSIGAPDRGGRHRRLVDLGDARIWGEFGVHLDEWIEEAASALAYAMVAAISVIDFEAIVIDGAMPATVRERLTAARRRSSTASIGEA